MMYTVDEGTTARVAHFFDLVSRHLPRRDQRESFATYAFGILGAGDRKSVEPIASRACGDPALTERLHDRLCHFVRESPWSDAAVRLEAARYAADALSKREEVTTWIVDDTGFLKQGRHSPGVQRQYTGSAGKIANCQIGVSLSIATRTEQVPIDFELYLPKVWTQDGARRKRARIPDDIRFMTKLELAGEMIGRAIEAGIPGEVVLADSAYGRSHEFREAVREFGLDYAVAVDAGTRVWVLDAKGRRRGEATRVDDLGAVLGPKAFRRITWRDATRGKLASNFCFRRVKVAVDDGSDPLQREPVWLVLEWAEGGVVLILITPPSGWTGVAHAA